MNKCIVIGRIAGDPESRTTQSGIAQCTFRLAVQRKYKSANGEREADFLTVVCWRQTAEYCARYLSKGSRVAVEGSVQTRSYNTQDGQKRTVTEIVADAVENLTGKNEAATEANATAQGAYQQTQTRQVGFAELSAEEMDQLPF